VPVNRYNALFHLWEWYSTVMEIFSVGDEDGDPRGEGVGESAPTGKEVGYCSGFFGLCQNCLMTRRPTRNAARLRSMRGSKKCCKPPRAFRSHLFIMHHSIQQKKMQVTLLSTAHR
jgi:hypothetical protein